jgi:hypothetical protein
MPTVLDDVTPATAPAIASVPTTKPAVAMTPNSAPLIAIALTTVPSVAMTPTTAPSEMVAEIPQAPVVPATQPVVSGSWTWETFGLAPSKITDAIVAATSQPSPIDADHGTTVTELPMDETNK